MKPEPPRWWCAGTGANLTRFPALKGGTEEDIEIEVHRAGAAVDGES